MIAGRNEHRRAARDAERAEHERHGVGVDTFLIEQVAGDQDRVRAALDRFLNRTFERAALVGAAFGAAVGRQPAKRPTQVEIGKLKERRDGHVGEGLQRGERPG